MEPHHAELIEENSHSIFISAVSLWEVSMLVAKQRLKPIFPLREWFEFATVSVGVPILPLTADVAREAYQLPGSFHEDPADRMIVATARIHNALLLSEDSKILHYPFVNVK